MLFLKGDKAESFLINGEANFSIKENQRTFFNVGSAGQPRDKNPEAACAVYDTETKEISTHRLSYDIEKTQNKMRKIGLPQKLIAPQNLKKNLVKFRFHFNDIHIERAGRQAGIRRSDY